MSADLPAWLAFASDAQRVALWGAALLAIAGLSAAMERRRHRRDRLVALDRVRWMPWTLVYLLTAMAGAGLLIAALPGLLNG